MVYFMRNLCSIANHGISCKKLICLRTADEIFQVNFDDRMSYEKFIFPRVADVIYVCPTFADKIIM